LPPNLNILVILINKKEQSASPVSVFALKYS